MGQLAGSTFGIPTAYPTSTNLGQGFGFQPFASQLTSGYGIGTGQPLQQVLQLLQIVPQQLQQVQYLQQQQLLHLQQLLQFVPAQLQQIQQLIQIVPQQIQQLQQQLQPVGSGFSSPLGFGLVPQAFPGQPAGHVM